MGFSHNLLLRKLLMLCLAGTLALLVSSCVISTKPIYFDKEREVAERATSRFQQLYSEQNFSGLDALRDKNVQTGSPDDFLREIRSNYDKLGKSLSTQLVQHKVFPSPGPGYTSQVRLAYETKFEKGEWTELFAWNIKDSSEAILAEYILDPTNNPSSSPTPK